MGDLYRIRNQDNLHRAWRWIKSNADASYKSYFRNLYRNYAVAEDALIANLADRLKRKLYVPTMATKLFFPKASGILRPYSLLTVEDQIVYQAAINLVAEKLFPRVEERYNKQVFGHLYAGKTSTWFYKKWKDGYRAFNEAARKAYNDGFIYAASFDLTAFYDSLDHHVLRHFLGKLGLDEEFCTELTKWLEFWTATDEGIFHNHGIPQGPLSSGLLSEVVLTHFDALKLKNVPFRYFRYVDDIRLFAKNRHDLRRLLVSLDLLSKDIGLFPQSGKIKIHKISNIEDELKSVSNPTETVIYKRNVDQKKLLQRITELTPRYKISNPTRFKYLLAHSKPSAKLTSRLWRIYENHPEIYRNVCNYLRRYPSIPRGAADKVVIIIKKSSLYSSVRAEFIDAINGRLHEAQDKELAKFLRQLARPTNYPDLLAAWTIFLVRTGKLTANQIVYLCKHARSWWTQATLVNELEHDYLGGATLNKIIDEMIAESTGDVALAAAWKSFVNSRKPDSKQNKWNTVGSILLQEVGMIQRTTASFCGINQSLKKLKKGIPKQNWNRFFSTEYGQAEKQAIEIAAVAGTNITAFVSALDVFNDLLLNAVFSNDGTIGSYTSGEIGSHLGSTKSRFAIKYPKTFKLAKEVHEARYQSFYSHPRVKSTNKPTRKIKYEFLDEARCLLFSAVSELSASGVL